MWIRIRHKNFHKNFHYEQEQLLSYTLLGTLCILWYQHSFFLVPSPFGPFIVTIFIENVFESSLKTLFVYINIYTQTKTPIDYMCLQADYVEFTLSVPNIWEYLHTKLTWVVRACMRQQCTVGEKMFINTFNYIS